MKTLALLFVILAASTVSASAQEDAKTNYPPVPDALMKAELTNLTGTTFKLEDYRGKVVLLMTWATWCGPCVTDMTEAAKLYDDYNGSGLEVIGLNIGSGEGNGERESRKGIKAFAKRLNINFELAEGVNLKKTAKALYSITRQHVVPQSILIDREGKLRAIFVGAGVRIFESRKTAVEKLFAESSAGGQNYRTSDGHDFSVSLKADKPTIMLGETTFLFFEIKNLSDTRLSFGDGGDYRNNIGRPDSYRVTVVRDDGKSVPQPKVTFSTGGLYGSQPVPVGGSYVRKLFVPHWATFEEPGTYTVTVTRTLGITGKEPSLRFFGDDKTPSITTKATTSLTVIKTEDERLGAVIRDTGTRMLNESDRDATRDYLQLLEFIKDLRTITYWIKAVHIYSLEPNADAFHRFAQTPRVLATYDAPEAWAELKSAMKSKSDKVRLDVADALSSSSNEQALSLLLTMQDDPYWFVRLRVAQRLNKEKGDAATAVLLKLLNDQNQDVWESAERALKERNKMPEDFPQRPLSSLTCPVRQVNSVKTMQTIGGEDPGTSGSSGVFLGGETCEKVLKAFEAELTERRSANDVLGEAWVLYQIGDSYRDARRYQQAHDNYLLALPLFRALKNVEAERGVLSDLASVSTSVSRYADALKYLQEELSLVRSSSNKSVRGDEGRILDRMSDLHFLLGDKVAGINFLLKRLDWETEKKSDYGQFIALKALGKGYERIGKKSEALASYEKALVCLKSYSKPSMRESLGDFLDDQIKELMADIQRLK